MWRPRPESCERFGFFELTDERGGETLDRVPVVKGEIRIGDRAYLQPDRLAAIRAAGADVIVRAGWRNARWLDADGGSLDLLEALRKVKTGGHLDMPVWIGRRSGAAVPMRLVAIRKLLLAAEAARRKARREARRGGHQLSKGTLAAANWVILVTSLAGQEFAAADILALIAPAGGGIEPGCA